MNTTNIQLFKEAFERLKADKPNNSDYIGRPITASLVSKEAGFTAGYLCRNRIQHRLLIEEINSFRVMTAKKFKAASDTNTVRAVLKN